MDKLKFEGLQKSDFGEVLDEHFTKKIRVKHIGESIAYVRTQERGVVMGIRKGEDILSEGLLKKDVKISEWERLLEELIRRFRKNSDIAYKEAERLVGEIENGNIPHEGEDKYFKSFKFLQATFFGFFLVDLFDEIISTNPRGWAIALYILACVINLVAFFGGKWKN